MPQLFHSVNPLLQIEITKESIIEKTYCCENLPLPTGRQANPSLPSGPEVLWAGGQRGGIPPFCLRPRAVSDPEGKGREGGI